MNVWSPHEENISVFIAVGFPSITEWVALQPGDSYTFQAIAGSYAYVCHPAFGTAPAGLADINVTSSSPLF